MRDGFTLLEALVVLFIAASLLALGALAYARYLEAQTLQALAADLRTFLRGSQTEAVRRGVSVAVVQRGSGLVACVDANADAACAQGEPTLLTLVPVSGGAYELGSPLRFNALGRPSARATVTVRKGSEAVVLIVERGGGIGGGP